MNDNECKCNNGVLWSCPSGRWWYSGVRLAALIFLVNALALTWLLLFDLMPREALAWFVASVFWVLALCLGVVRWP